MRCIIISVKHYLCVLHRNLSVKTPIHMLEIRQFMFGCAKTAVMLMDGLADSINIIGTHKVTVSKEPTLAPSLITVLLTLRSSLLKNPIFLFSEFNPSFHY